MFFIPDRIFRTFLELSRPTMSIPLHPALRTAIWAVAAPLGLYCVFLGLGMTPFFQRQYGLLSNLMCTVINL